MGRYCPEALGDYFAGPNHTLPTSGTARFSSPLSVDDFIKKTQYTYYTENALKKVSDDIYKFAMAEGLFEEISMICPDIMFRLVIIWQMDQKQLFAEIAMETE